jgi:hypothetical protein
MLGSRKSVVRQTRGHTFCLVISVSGDDRRVPVSLEWWMENLDGNTRLSSTNTYTMNMVLVLVLSIQLALQNNINRVFIRSLMLSLPRTVKLSKLDIREPVHAQARNISVYHRRSNFPCISFLQDLTINWTLCSSSYPHTICFVVVSNYPLHGTQKQLPYLFGRRDTSMHGRSWGTEC